MAEQDDRTAHLIGREYVATRYGIVGTLVRSVRCRGWTHFWLDLGNVCTLVSVQGTIGAWVVPAEDVEKCRRRSKRWPRDEERERSPTAPAVAG